MGLIRLIGHFGDYFEDVGGFDAGVAFGCGPVFGGSGVPFGASGVEFELGAEGGLPPVALRRVVAAKGPTGPVAKSVYSAVSGLRVAGVTVRLSSLPVGVERVKA